MKKRIEILRDNTTVGYIIAFLTGLAVGFRVMPQFVGVPYLFLGIACIFFASRNDLKTVLTILPYLIYNEIYVRAYVSVIPYLFMPYLLIGIFGILIFKNKDKVKIHTKSLVLLFLFLVIEFLNSYRAQDPNIARFLTINSLTMFVVVFWSSFNIVSPLLVNKFLNSVKYASIYLCGIVLARYLMGAVVFTGLSSSEATNGLAPVQLSGYLGFSCSVFFLSIMNSTSKREMVLELLLLSISAIVMLLSFSRGGLYFIGVIMILYFLFNRTKLKSYFLLLLLIPFGLLVFYYVSEKTNGLIVERYQDEGTSGRDQLIQAGWDLFLTDPLIGVGTGNFNQSIKEKNLYGEESGAHNEFIRVAAEHGILGMVTYYGFFIFLFIEIVARKKIQREYAIYFLVFFCLIVVHNGLKISLQPLLLMLAIGTPSVIRVMKKKNVSAAYPILTN